MPKYQSIRSMKRGTAMISKACVNIYTKGGDKYDDEQRTKNYVWCK